MDWYWCINFYSLLACNSRNVMPQFRYCVCITGKSCLMRIFKGEKIEFPGIIDRNLSWIRVVKINLPRAWIFLCIVKICRMNYKVSEDNFLWFTFPFLKTKNIKLKLNEEWIDKYIPPTHDALNAVFEMTRWIQTI